MKFLITAFLVIYSISSFSAETYDCDFGEIHSLLYLKDDQTVSLENKFQKFDCEKSFVYFPGTEIELPTLICAGRFKKITYYMSQYDENTIILTRNIVFSRDVSCKKISR